LSQFTKYYNTFNPKIATKLSQIWLWDQGSEIRKQPIPDPGITKAPDSGSATLKKSTRHFNMVIKNAEFLSNPLKMLKKVPTNIISAYKCRNYALNGRLSVIA
jgi:hypothetical protein